MLKNYFRIAWRSLRKDRQFSGLNIIGLSGGIACTLLIWLWVADQKSVDKFFEKDDQIYQLMEHRKSADNLLVSDESSGSLAEAVKTEAPEVEYSAALCPPEWFPAFTLSVGQKNIKAKGQYAGKDYFNIFSFKLLDGKKDDVLKDKNSIVISDDLARRLFNTTDNLIGRPIRLQQQHDFFISGVFEKPPSLSSQQFDFVLSFDYFYDQQSWVKTWGNTGPHNFVLLKKGTDIDAFNKRIEGIIGKNSSDTTRSAIAMKFSDVYLFSSFSHGASTGGRTEYIRLFSLIALFILVIACINFMNLSTARAGRRMKEVGIKKVVGARRPQLIAQFLSESMLVTLFSMGLGIAITWLLLPSFNQLTGRGIALTFTPALILALLCIALFTGLLAGCYPALYLSKFNPLAVLKGKLPSSFAEVVSRKGLVTFQFALSAILIVSVLVIYRQVQYIQSADPGYNKDNILKFYSEGRLQGNEEAFIRQMKRIPGVVNASFTYNDMVGRNFGNNGLDWPGKPANTYVYFEGFGAGYDFIETLGMHMQSGRSFSREYGADSNKIILNEAAVAVMHLKDPVGKTIRLFGSPIQILGVIKDFHFESLHEPVKPAYYTLQTQASPWWKIMVRIRPGQQQETIARIKDFYQAYNPGFPFTYSFLDDEYQRQYQTEVRVAALAKYFSGLAILISCLGLFGLAAFTAQRRQKEIGIRKVVGASVNNIVVMLSGEFLRLIFLAILVAFPLAWWAMSRWLQGFAYRIDIGPVVFLVAGSSVIGITFITIGFQAIRAALVNPVKSLRSE
ncbi:MAG TPA: ABC transporter permease [Puia sp.]|nr:ABC transporter permease [Puia sp.]